MTGVRNSTTEIGTRRLHYVGSPLKILKNTKCGRKLGDIGKPWVEDKGHDQTVFSDEYFASVPGSLTNEVNSTLTD